MSTLDFDTFSFDAFEFDAFEEGSRGSGGAFRPHLSGWGLRYWLEARAAAARRRIALETAEREERERLERELAEIAARTIEAAAQPTHTTLKLATRSLVQVDAELEEWGALLAKIACEVEDLPC